MTAPLPPAFSRRRLFWWLQIGGWTALVPPLLSINLFAGFPLRLALINGVFRQVVGFLLTLLLWRVYRRWSPARMSTPRCIAAAAACILAVTAFDLGFFELLRVAFHWDFRTTVGFPLLLSAIPGRLVLYSGWSALYLVLQQFLDARDRLLELAQSEVAARDAELLTLRAQLHPHFLFNALNAIVAEADDNPARVKTITRGLSDLLRFSIRQRQTLAPLNEEIGAIENYLRIEQLRFEERLSWRLDVAPAVGAARVPCALLLPLVENAIKFGLRTSPAHLALRIGAAPHDGCVAAFVENSGRWVEPDPTDTRSTQIGLANLRRRLELLYGARAQVDISFPPESVRVEVRVPLAAPAP